MEKAVVDRIIGDKAVLLIGEKEEERVVPLSALPQGAKEGSWLQLKTQDYLFESFELDRETTDRQADQINNRLERIRKRMGSKFKK